MPTPSKFEAVVPFCGNEERIQANTFEAGDLCVFSSKDVSDDSGMALVLVDREKLQTKSIQPDKGKVIATR